MATCDCFVTCVVSGLSVKLCTELLFVHPCHVCLFLIKINRCAYRSVNFELRLVLNFIFCCLVEGLSESLKRENDYFELFESVNY